MVVPDFDLLKERKIVNAKEVIRFDIEGISAKIPSTKRIGSYEIWQDALPRTTTRKLKRFEWKSGCAQTRKKDNLIPRVSSAPALTAEDTQWLEQPEVQQALKIIRESSKTAPEVIRPSDNLELDLGLDSMQRIELLVAVEKELGGDVEESALAEIYTVRQLVDAIRESAASGKTRTSYGSAAGGVEIGSAGRIRPIRKSCALARPGRVAEHFLYAAFQPLQIFAHDRFHLRVSGLEKLPAQGRLHYFFQSPELPGPACAGVRSAVDECSAICLRWAPAKFSVPVLCAVWRAGCE